MNKSYHYHTTAAVVAEALVARGIDKAETARIAIIVARSNEMVDWATPRNLPITMADELGMVPVVTQVYPGWATRMALRDATWPIMASGHRWHFDPENGWRVVCGQINMVRHLDGWGDEYYMTIGAHLHTAQDTDGPHAGYVGYPCKSNYERTQELGQLSWYEKVLPKRATWGHMLDADADKIERCRDGAVDSAVRLYELVSGCDLDSIGCDWPESLIAIENARNDADLEARQRRVFQFATGQELPEFEPFDGEDLEAWFSTVMG